MRTKPVRSVQVEISENAIPMEEALTALARVIAAGMLKEEKKREGKS